MARKSAYVKTRIDPNLKKSAENIFQKLGLSTSNAINVFYTQVVTHQGIPFDLTLSDEEYETKLEVEDTKDNYIEVKDEEQLKSLIGLE